MNAPLRVDLQVPLRSVFISDVHLGSANCHADALADFLHAVRCQRLYLVGDIFDLW
jgi:UDP-2,3-diacylglucosamine pyrophosphatase LpxH